MKITVEVELYCGAHKQTEYIEISEDDLKALAEHKAKDENYCTSCKAVEITLQVNA